MNALGHPSGAVAYLDYLRDVPPPGVPEWGMALLAGSLLVETGDVMGGLSFLEMGQAQHGDEDEHVKAIAKHD